MAAYISYGNPDEWPDDSFQGKERALADALNDDTLEYIENVLDIDPTDDDLSIYYLYTMLMMHPAAALALTDVDEADLETGDIILKLIDDLRDDANENSSDYFKQRLQDRLALRKTLRRLGDHFARRIEED